MSDIQLIKCVTIDDAMAIERLQDGIRGVIRHGSNPYQVRGNMQVRVTPIMGTSGDGMVYLLQLFKGGVVIACGHCTTV